MEFLKNLIRSLMRPGSFALAMASLLSQYRETESIMLGTNLVR